MEEALNLSSDRLLDDDDDDDDTDLLPLIHAEGAVGATSRNLAVSVPDGVMGSFTNNPSGRTMGIGSTRPVTEMSTRNIFLGGG